MTFEQLVKTHMKDICTRLNYDFVIIDDRYIIFTDNIYIIEEELYNKGFEFESFLYTTNNNYYVVGIKFINTEW